MTMPRPRSEEHTYALQTHRYLPSFPTRRFSDLLALAHHDGEIRPRFQNAGAAAARPSVKALHDHAAPEIGRAHVCTPDTPISTLFPYTTLFRSPRARAPRR